MSISKFLLKQVDLKKEIYGHIYKITNQINNKSYIGQTTSKNKCRWNGTLKGARVYNKHLQNSIEKYGVENFKIEIIDSAKDINSLNKKEIYHIKNLNCLFPNGYNLINHTTRPIKFIFSKDFLESEYILKRKNMIQIGIENQCSNTTIRNFLLIYDIPRRKGGYFKKYIL